MWTLAFDTTTNFCSIILMNQTSQKAFYSKEMTFGQSEVLIPQIKSILDANQLCFSDVDLVAVCTGPGSFTGVRSSLATAKAFGLSAPDLKIAGVSAFDVYIRNLKKDQCADINVALVETKREDFYAAYYDRELNLIAPPEAAFAQDIVKKIEGKNISLVGDGAARFVAHVEKSNICYVDLETHPDVKTLALIAIEQLKQKRIVFPNPLYLKAPNTCVK